MGGGGGWGREGGRQKEEGKGSWDQLGTQMEQTQRWSEDGGAVSGEVGRRSGGRVAALMRGPGQGRVRSGCAGSWAGWWSGSASLRVFPA